MLGNSDKSLPLIREQSREPSRAAVLKTESSISTGEEKLTGAYQAGVTKEVSSTAADPCVQASALACNVHRRWLQSKKTKMKSPGMGGAGTREARRVGKPSTGLRKVSPPPDRSQKCTWCRPCTALLSAGCPKARHSLGKSKATSLYLVKDTFDVVLQA